LETSPTIGETGRAEGDRHRGLLRWRLDDDAARSRLCGPVIVVGACVFGNGRDNPSKRSEVATATVRQNRRDALNATVEARIEH
jgi:hypothetical protein